MDKHLARKTVRLRLQNLTNKAFLDRMVFESFININLDNYENFCVYKSLNCEVDTECIINYLLENNKKVYLPCIEKEDMKLVKINKDTKFEKGAFLILEPIGEKLSVENVNIDVCITPLLGFDKNLNRLGKGKGYFDRFFEKTNCFKIGLAYDIQQIDKIDVEEFDVKLDLIITPSRIYNESN